MKQIIHVNKNTIASNRKHNRWEPAIIVRQGRKRQYGFEIAVKDAAGTVIGTFKQVKEPLDCGARVYFEQCVGSCEVIN